MAESLFNRLEKIPVSNKKQRFAVKFGIQGKSDNKPKTRIVNKTREDFNRNAILKNLRRRVALNKAPNSPKPLEPPPEVSLPVIPEEPIVEDKVDVTAKPKKKGKKRKKRVKIVKFKPGKHTTVSRKAAREETRKVQVTTRDGDVIEIDPERIKIDDKFIEDRLPPKMPPVTIRSSDYYMNNRKIFLEFITNLFQPYREEILDSEKEISCELLSENRGGPFQLLTHQSIVRDYMTLYTPYRGLLLFHGLGAGKTCASINIAESIAAVSVAEGIKNPKQILIMTPASLRSNYVSEIKKCGDPFYKKTQYWEPINITQNPALAKAIANVFNISPLFFTKTNNGIAWLVDNSKESNYETLDNEQRVSLNKQINEMILSKYQFLNYNGIRKRNLDEISNNGTENPFDNKIVIIDEAHNFVSRIVNKLKKPESLSMILYRYILSAQNSKFVFLTGTPIINYPNEMGIMFNMLRGYIKTFQLRLQIHSGKVDLAAIKRYLKPIREIDYIQYKSQPPTLIVTRNPHGFINNEKGDSYLGVSLREFGMLSDVEFIGRIKGLLSKNNIDIIHQVIQPYTALPEKLDTFNSLFIDDVTGNMKNTNMFKRRIMGLTSYFRSATEGLMPDFDIDKDLRVIEVPMSDYQFKLYEDARKAERDRETKNARKMKGQSNTDALFSESTSTYRIFSRLFCNFVFPRKIGRPMPRDGESVESAIQSDSMSEDTVDDKSAKEMQEIGQVHDADDESKLSLEISKTKDETYKTRMIRALDSLKQQSAKYLNLDGELDVYSPKFYAVIENILSDENIGLNLIYSQFRSLEGVGILKLVLEANGFAEFDIKKSSSGVWELNIADEDRGKKMFALYTGTEDREKKEIVRNIYNNDWEAVPPTIREALMQIHDNNLHGEIIKVLMITSSGAEGINLKNTRYVHIIEPYWHPVRVEQVIGRARRICSHKDLPLSEKNVKVFIYLMSFTQEQLEDEASVKLKLKDIAKDDNGFFTKGRPLTSDQYLYEISTRKERINRQILRAIKESAIDCAIHSTAKSTEKLKCYSMGNPTPAEWAYVPSYEGEERDQITKINQREKKIRAKQLTFKGKKYAVDPATKFVYDLDSYLQGNPRKVGDLIIKGKRSGIRFI
jgi:hypothetical protein